jgi:copper(I)-binding protein
MMRAALLAGLIACPFAASGAPPLAVSAAFAVATPPGANAGAVYFTLTNAGAASATLIEATSPAAKSLAVHESTLEGGIARMRERTLVVAPRGRVTLVPGGLHLMLMGLAQPLREGQRIALRLVFQDGTVLETTVPVRAPGTVAP